MTLLCAGARHACNTRRPTRFGARHGQQRHCRRTALDARKRLAPLQPLLRSKLKCDSCQAKAHWRPAGMALLPLLSTCSARLRILLQTSAPCPPLRPPARRMSALVPRHASRCRRRATRHHHNTPTHCACAQVLTEDYSKSVFLCNDRTLAFHTRMGKHYVTRIPKAGRDLAYLPHLAEIAVAGSAPEIWRFSLSEGRFLTPLPATAAAVNALGVSPVHGMMAAAGDDGVLECFDVRAAKAIGHLDVSASLGAPDEGLTTVRFDSSGMFVAAGTSGAAHPTLFCARRCRVVRLAATAPRQRVYSACCLTVGGSITPYLAHTSPRCLLWLRDHRRVTSCAHTPHPCTMLCTAA